METVQLPNVLWCHLFKWLPMESLKNVITLENCNIRK